MKIEAAGSHTVAVLTKQATRSHIPPGWRLLPYQMLHCVGVRSTDPDISKNCCAFIYRVKRSKKRGRKIFYLTEIIIIFTLHSYINNILQAVFFRPQSGLTIGMYQESNDYTNCVWRHSSSCFKVSDDTNMWNLSQSPSISVVPNNEGTIIP